MPRVRVFWSAMVSVAAVAIVAIAAVPAIIHSAENDRLAAQPARGELATPKPTPLSPAQELLATTGGSQSCAVTFAGTTQALKPLLAERDHRMPALPVPEEEGKAFAGWYPDAAAATAMEPAKRVNDSRVTTCTDAREVNLTAAWVDAATAKSSKTRVPILMYHQFTQKPEGEDNWLKGNFVYVPTFAAHMQYLKDQGYYLPSWQELHGFLAGTVVLPERSVIITDDDADPTWIQWAAPIVAEKQLLTTSFVITSARKDPTPNEWVIQRSHTHDMHSAGANGKGKMVNYSVGEMVTDLNTSSKILGATEVLAYPFGHYNDASKQALTQSGFAMAVTTKSGQAVRGDDPLALPRVRINFGMSVQQFANALGH